MDFIVSALGNKAAMIELGSTISLDLHRKLIAMHDWHRSNPFPGFQDLIIGYTSLTIIYEPQGLQPQVAPHSTVFDWVSQRLNEGYHRSVMVDDVQQEPVHIPVCYDTDFGPDLGSMAQKLKIDVEEIIAIHHASTYRVFMNGFLPGFAYLGLLDDLIACNRKTAPVPVTAGSVGIAGRQTGIYPIDSPGGWNIIGRTPLALFSKKKSAPALLRPGDDVKFYPVDRNFFDEYQRKEQQTEN